MRHDKVGKQQSRLYGKVLKSFYGLDRHTLMGLPFETRLGIRAVAFSIMSALNYGSASMPENNDVHSNQ